MVVADPNILNYVPRDESQFDFVHDTWDCPSMITATIVYSTEWECELSPMTIFTPLDGCEPNWFHRWMHRVFFGFRWQRKEA